MTTITTPGFNPCRSSAGTRVRAQARWLVRALGITAAAAALAGSLTGPAQALDVTIVTPRPKITFKPDLQMESLEVNDFGNGWYQLKATVRNGGSNPSPLMQAYPGGGKLRLLQTSGGRTPNPAPFTAASQPDPTEVVYEWTIPALARGEAATRWTWTNRRAIYTAVVEPTASESNTANNSVTVNKLRAGQFNVSTGQLQEYLNSLGGQFQIHLHKSDAFAKLPGFYESHWNIADLIREDVLPQDAAHWSMHDVNVQSAFVSMGNEGLLVVTLSFETSGPELNGHQEPGPGNAVPDLNASPVTATVKIPLQFNAPYQYLFCGAPQVTVAADMNTVWPAQPWMATDFRNKVKNAVTDLFNDAKVKQKISYEINRQIKQEAVPHGRILSADYNASYIKLHTQVP